MNKRDIRPWRRRIILSAKILLVGLLLIFLFNSGRIDFNLIFKAYKNPGSLLLGIICCFLALLTPIFRWLILTRLQKLPLGVHDAFRLTMIGYFFNLFIPGGSGGDVVRAAYTIRDCPERRPQALTVIFVDRGLGLHALLLLVMAIFFYRASFFYNYPNLRIWIFCIAVIFIVGTLLALLLVWGKTNSLVLRLLGRIIGGTEAWHESIALYRIQLGMVGMAYIFSMLSALFNVFAIHFMMLAVGSKPTVVDSLFIAPFVILANTLPFTPGGLGVAESTSSWFYEVIGVAGGANGMLLTRVFIVLFALFGLPFFLMNRRVLDSKFQEQ